MRKFLISAALISAAAIAAPASAQHGQGQHQGQGRYGHSNYGQGGQSIERQLDQLQERIARARARRLISNNEARNLFRQAEQIDRLHYQYRRNGLSQGEFHDLQNRIQNLRHRIQGERREGREDRRDDRRDDRRNRW